MRDKLVASMMLLVLLVSMLTLAFNIQSVKGSGDISINVDGSVTPATAPIDREGDIYTFTDNISDRIIVAASNITIDGNGYTLQGTGAPGSEGMVMVGTNNVTVENLIIRQFFYGIYFWGGNSNDNIVGNTITDGAYYGVLLFGNDCGNNITGNTIDLVPENSFGIYLSGADNNTISENNITNGEIGVYLYSGASNNSVVGNNITNMNGACVSIWLASNNNVFGNTLTHTIWYGVFMYGSSNNIVSGNTLAYNEVGASLVQFSTNNIFSENNITDSTDFGVFIGESSSNKFYHNNFKDNTEQVRFHWLHGGANVWDDGYPSGGNYWSDYTGPDTNGDGIGDNPYVLDEENQDRYPLMTPWHACTLTVHVVGSGSVSLSDPGPYVYGTAVELTALPTVGWEFTGWSGDLSGSANPETIVMDGNKIVYANFVQLTYTLTVNCVGSGSVSLSDPGPYVYGTAVELTALPTVGWEFTGWSGDLSGSANPETIVMDGNKIVNAIFTEIPPEEGLEELILTVETMNLPTGIEASLIRKLDAALVLLNRGNQNGAIHKLMDFIDQVEGQRGKFISDEQADQLIAEAKRIINQMQE